MTTPLKKSADAAPRSLASALRRMTAVVSVVSLKFSASAQPRRGNSKLRSLGSLDSTPTHYQTLLVNPLSNDALRNRLSRRAGGERLEFLLSCWNFDGAANSLQRFAQLSHIIERFVQAHAARPVQLPDQWRNGLLQEWALWSSEGRIPPGIRLRALEAAAEEIHKQVADDPLTPFLLSQAGRS